MREGGVQAQVHSSKQKNGERMIAPHFLHPHLPRLQHDTLEHGRKTGDDASYSSKFVCLQPEIV